MADEQLELPFMAALHRKYDTPQKPDLDDIIAFEESSIVAIFDGQDMSLFELEPMDCWFEGLDLAFEILIFSDTDTGKCYRAERLKTDRAHITNFINDYEVYDARMLELPEVKYGIDEKGSFNWIYC